MPRFFGKILKNVINIILLIIIFLFISFPFYELILISQSVPGSFPTKLLSLPTFRLDSFLYVLGIIPYTTPVVIWPYLLNSLIIAFSTCLISLAIVLPSSYTLSRYKHFLCKYILTSSMLFRTLPSAAIIIPVYILVKDLGLLGSYFGIILGHLTFSVPLGLWLMYGFFNQIPVSIEESALIDGASRSDIFSKIILPLSKPGVTACLLITFWFSYVDYIFAVTLGGAYTTPLPVKIAGFFSSSELVPPELYSIAAAYGIISLIPSITLFIFIQKYFETSLTFYTYKG